jgi:lambda family phage portal protein
MKFGWFGFRSKENRGTRSSPSKINRRSYYEAVAPASYMKNQWKKADGRDVNGPILDSLEVARNRCRYEIANNPLALSAITSLADAVIGSGPQLQMTTLNKNANMAIEKAFDAWSRVCDFRGMQTFGQILRMISAFDQCGSGEGFLIEKTVRNEKSPVGLRLLVVESDRIGTPFGKSYFGNVVDGIEIGDEGSPVAYHVAKKHPGDFYSFQRLYEYDRIPADLVIHLFRPTRPGQFRGFPWLAPALHQFAELRSFASSTLEAADMAARVAGVLESDSTFSTNEPEDYEAFDPIEVDKSSFMTLPRGMKASQFKPEQPSTTYKEFYECKLREIGRVLNMPFNVISGDSSSYNYASGRLDYQNWFKYVRVTQDWIERAVCDRIFRDWLQEAVLIPEYLDLSGIDIEEVLSAAPEWHWPGTEHVDPEKEANAQTTRLHNLTATLADEWAKAGQDWETKLRQRKRELDFLKELGIEQKDALPEKKDNHDGKNQQNEDGSDSESGQSIGKKSRIRVAI